MKKKIIIEQNKVYGKHNLMMLGRFAAALYWKKPKPGHFKQFRNPGQNMLWKEEDIRSP